MLNYRERFRLFAHGESFDVDAYMQTAALSISRTFRRGEYQSNPEIGVFPLSSGIDIFLAEGKIPIPDQERIAIDYLRANREHLQVLRRFPGVTTFILALQYDQPDIEGMLGFSLSLSASLMQLALEVGISPTFYVWLRCLADGDG